MNTGPAPRFAGTSGYPHKRRAVAAFASVFAALLLVATAGCRVPGPGDEPDKTDMTPRPDARASLCSPVNCNGCCNGDVCEPGITASACGTAGNLCAVCAGYQLCQADFKCAADPNGKWLLAATQAELALNNPQTGKPWHADGSAIKPYVTFGKQALSGVLAQQTGTPPVWSVTWGLGFEYAAKDLINPGVDLQVRDQVGAAPATGDPVLSSVHPVKLAESDFAKGLVTYTGWEGVNKISFAIQKR